MKLTRAEWTVIFIVVMSFMLAFVLYPIVPEKLVSHWDMYGEPNGVMSKFWGLFLMPFISVALFLFFIIFPKIDPKSGNIEKFRNYFDRFIVSLFVFLFYIFVLTLFWNIGSPVPIIPFLSAALGLFFFSVGSLVSHSEINWTIGIRTPWTLSSETVWKKTHKLGGILFKITGGIVVLSILVPQFSFVIVITSILLAVFISVVYSYILYAKEKK